MVFHPGKTGAGKWA